MDTPKKEAASTKNDSKDNPNLTSKASSQPWTRTGDKLKDDLNLFSTGCFYDCTFMVSNELTNESKVCYFS
jgi:hypothetical protein